MASYCKACGGWGKHRLGCPCKETTKAEVKPFPPIQPMLDLDWDDLDVDWEPDLDDTVEIDLDDTPVSPNATQFPLPFLPAADTIDEFVNRVVARLRRMHLME